MSVLLTVAILLLAVLVAALASALVVIALRFPRGADSFACRLRAVPRDGVNPPGWPRGRARAVWSHDVLLVRQGLLRVRLQIFAVSTAQERLRVLERGELRGLGPAPLAAVLTLDDGRRVELAAPADARIQLVGPFLAAAVPGPRSGPTDRKNLGR